MRRVAVVGAGISGLAAARALARESSVTLYEAGAWFGGHAHTVDLTLDGVTHGVDTGFLVYNRRTYPGLVSLFEELGIVTAESEMSFSVQSAGLEWSGSNLDGLFAQRRNLVSPRFWQMLAQILRFNRLATCIAEQGDEAGMGETVGAFLDRNGFGAAFRDDYLLPMVGCIWSCPTAQMLEFPIGTLIRFCHNHGLIQVSDRPQWYTVRGGSRRYVERIVRDIADARLSTPVRSVRRLPGGRGVVVASEHGSERFDEVVLACHSDQSLALLADPRPVERELLGSIRYQRNEAVLHTDSSVLPRSRRAWAAWNYERGRRADDGTSPVCLHYLINRLQPLPWQRPVIVTLNPTRPIEPRSVFGRWDYAHPVFDLAAVRAQPHLRDLQGTGGVWFCGAWTRYGFHEDGLSSGQAVADAIRRRWAQAPELQAA